MPKFPNNDLLTRSRRMPIVLFALALIVLAGSVALTTLQVREGIRSQIAGRDGEVLYAVVQRLYADEVANGDAEEQLNILLKCAEIRGILGVRLFDANGKFVDCFPVNVVEQTLTPDYLPRLQKHQPISHYSSEVEMWRLFYPDEKSELNGSIPLLEVTVPLHAEGQPLAGVAQFLVAGQSIAAEFATLDGWLWRQGLIAFGAGALVLGCALIWAFRRLTGAHRQLAERTDSLVRANQELVLAAKTSALGTVTAHLIHGLKNPLAGLQNFVAARNPTGDQPEAVEWQQAVASTRRMQSMINQVVGVLREDQTATRYEITLAEVEQMVRAQVQPLARERGVGFASVIRAEAALPNRTANLLGLILVNLCENAVHVTTPPGSATLKVERCDGGLRFEVQDAGPGFPADIPVFMPCRSTKEGGTGIGLALCKQLALHIGAELELSQSTPKGCVFALTLPLPVGEAKPERQRSRLQTGDSIA